MLNGDIAITHKYNGYNGEDHGGICLLPSEFRVLITGMLLSQLQERVDL